MVDMCANVCECKGGGSTRVRASPAERALLPFRADGGHDTLPNTLAARAAEPGTHVLAAESGEGRLDALLCMQRRGDALWLWGARTREQARGQGLAQLLLVHAERHAEATGVTVLLSTTIQANPAMVHVFQKLGYQHQKRVHCWPAWEVHNFSRAARGLQPLPLPPEQQAAPGAPGTALAEAAAAAASPGWAPSWRVCVYPEELAQAVAALQQPVWQATGADAVPPSAYSWLPGWYEVHPVGASVTLRLIEQGRVWLLGEAAAPDAVLALPLQPPEDAGPAMVSVVADGPTGLHAALVHAGGLVGAGRAMYCYVAAGNKFDPAPLLDTALEFLVFQKKCHFE